ncbi:MAG: hypothetical protein JEZ07_14860 [Phycisphaerae bacterium]|nr:hypothetical protein [Phycisphaerae bacterium]
MGKRLIMMGATFLGIILLLLVYMHFNSGLGIDSSTIEKPDGSGETDNSSNTDMIVAGNEDTRIGDIEDFEYLKKANGRIERIRFEERTPNKEGYLELKKPVAELSRIKIHQDNKDESKNYMDFQTVRVSARSLLAPVDLKQGEMPEQGKLTGDVVVEMYRQKFPLGTESPVFNEKDAILEFRVQMADVTFRREMSDLRTDSKIIFESPKVKVVGSKLEIKFDQINQRLQYLELREPESISFDAGSFDPAKMTAETNSETEPTVEPVETKTKPEAKPKRSKAATYQLSLLQNVVIDMPDKQQKISADSIVIEIGFDPADDKFKDEADAPQDNSDPTANDDTTEPVSNFITLTCDGPLEITTLEKDFNKNHFAFTATGNLENNKAVTITEFSQNKPEGLDTFKCDRAVFNRMMIENDMVLYNHMVLESKSDKAVELSISEDQYVSANDRIVIWQQQKENWIRLFGPGQVRMLYKDGAALPETTTDKAKEARPPTPIEMDYENQVEIALYPESNIANAFGNKTKPEIYIKSINIIDRVETRFETVEDTGISYTKVIANGIHSDFWQPAKKTADAVLVEKGKPLDLLRLMQFRNNIEVLTATNKEYLNLTNSFSCESLDIAFEGDSKENNELIVTAIGKVDLQTEIYQMNSPGSIVLKFRNVDPAIALVAGDKADKLLALLKNRQLSQAILKADDIDGQVYICDNENGFEARGHSIIGASDNDLRTSGSWTLAARPGQQAQIDYIDQKVADGTKADKITLLGEHIEMDTAKNICTINDTGNIAILSKTKLDGNISPEPLEININWHNGADFILDEQKIVFRDVTATAIEQYSSTVIKCPVMTISFEEFIKADGKKTRNLKNFIATRTDGDMSVTDNTDMVSLESIEYDPVTKDLSQQVAMQAQQITLNNNATDKLDEKGNIIFEKTLLVDGEGWIHAFNFPVAQEEQQAITSLEDFNVADFDVKTAPQPSGLFSSTEPGYNLIHFTGQLQYDTQTITLNDGIALHHVPLVDDQLPYDENQQLIWNKNTALLHCDSMIITGNFGGMFVKDKTSEDKNLIVKAQGDVVFRMASDDSNIFFFASESFTYDQQADEIIALGKPDKPIQFDSSDDAIRISSNQQWLKFNLGSYDLHSGSEPLTGEIEE